MWESAMSFVSNIFKPVSDLVDNIHTSKEEELTLRNALVKLQNDIALKQMDLLSKQMDLEKQLLDAKSSIIVAESKSDSWIARSWRPITMLTFLVIIVFHSLGLINLEPEFAEQFMLLVQIGLGGYVVGRSAEKVAPSLAKAIGKN